MLIGFQLNGGADLGAVVLPTPDAGFQQPVRQFHLAELELQFTHLVVQLLLHHLEKKERRISNALASQQD